MIGAPDATHEKRVPLAAFLWIGGELIGTPSDPEMAGDLICGVVAAARYGPADETGGNVRSTFFSTPQKVMAEPQDSEQSARRLCLEFAISL